MVFGFEATNLLKLTDIIFINFNIAIFFIMLEWYSEFFSIYKPLWFLMHLMISNIQKLSTIACKPAKEFQSKIIGSISLNYKKWAITTHNFDFIFSYLFMHTFFFRANWMNSIKSHVLHMKVELRVHDWHHEYVISN